MVHADQLERYHSSLWGTLLTASVTMVRITTNIFIRIATSYFVFVCVQRRITKAIESYNIQRQTAVTVHFKIIQLMLFAFLLRQTALKAYLRKRQGLLFSFIRERKAEFEK